MTDKLSPERRSANMGAVRDRNTRPEMIVRRTAFALGYRYRVHRRDLPGKPDLVFSGRKAVIFVHGCFWHGHDCPRGSIPAANREFWTAKLSRNIARDKDQLERLAGMGWRSLVVWECQLRSRNALVERISAFLDRKA